MKTKHLVVTAIVFLLLAYAYPRLKAVKWIEPARKEWYGPVGGIQNYYFVEYLHDGEQRQLGEIWDEGFGWQASTFECGILYHVRHYATKELAMQAVEKWCGKGASEPGKGETP